MAEGTNGTSVLQKLLLWSFAIHLKMTSAARVAAIFPLFSDHRKPLDMILIH
jgi:hypothetical protein